MNRDKRVANYVLILYCALSLTALSLPLSAPVQSLKIGVSYLVHPVPFYGARALNRIEDRPAAVMHLIDADIENRGLREDLKRLPVLESELGSLRRENERLKTELGMKPAQGRVLHWAKVIQRDPMNWYRFLMVDAGQRDGLVVNAPVLGLVGGRLGVVGRVSEVGPKDSKVLLLTDETSAAASYIPSKQWEGLVEGQGGPRLRMNYLPLDAKLIIGDAVYTSGTSPTFPPDLLVGYITRVFQQDPFLTFQSVELAPAVEPSSVQEVLILSSQQGVPEKTP